MKKVVFIAAIFSSIVFWDKIPYSHRIKQFAMDYGIELVEKSSQLVRKISGNERLCVFERRVSEEQVLAMFAKDKASAELLFVPHVLMRVRFSGEEDKRAGSHEGAMLWSLSNGEMVLNTGSWTYSKGFRECLMLKAGKQDVQLMQVLAGMGGSASREVLSQALSMRNVRADRVIRACQKKKLIFTHDNLIYSHFQQPQPIKGCMTVFNSSPVWLAKPKGSTVCSVVYPEDRIQNLVEMIFGDNFFILSSEQIHVPVYKVSIAASDSSVRVEYINAITGKSFDFAPTYCK
ncbi:hypothetical protein [Chlamydia trachomatis]|uniref:hypothetical protein n=1 Tax=Chlamydia trachomatis TaxID=813 RepID=UPI0001B46F9B|nr:hypothetical protein [Chlamydia trachomatis]AGR97706.1 hypothetical protein CTRC953_02865 [Chlamydia trachomatis RC-J/953]AGS00490.1 hypothetical protein CTRC122_02900 [Chlamydia trachomatis RC-J(s)/122]AGS02360.1 hypothetical protein CTJTET1_02895 [Chlamydia trachomatis J/6276tet1]AGS03316.1 hypothetical protein CTRC971_02875 [Chlamydia trachomatis RC-J/971]AGT71002.1 membrane protein [Chlamydia trachomatis]